MIGAVRRAVVVGRTPDGRGLPRVCGDRPCRAPPSPAKKSAVAPGSRHRPSLSGLRTRLLIVSYWLASSCCARYSSPLPVSAYTGGGGGTSGSSGGSEIRSVTHLRAIASSRASPCVGRWPSLICRRISTIGATGFLASLLMVILDSFRECGWLPTNSRTLKWDFVCASRLQPWGTASFKLGCALVVANRLGTTLSTRERSVRSGPMYYLTWPSFHVPAGHQHSSSFGQADVAGPSPRSPTIDSERQDQARTRTLDLGSQPPPTVSSGCHYRLILVVVQQRPCPCPPLGPPWDTSLEP